MCLLQAVLRGLSAKFSQATEMMRWLKEAANISTRSTEQPVSWTTPLGLRCVQPYLINVCPDPSCIDKTAEQFHQQAKIISVYHAMLICTLSL